MRFFLLSPRNRRKAIIRLQQKNSMSEILFENYNFSKIGKYISNKLHHIHKTKRDIPKSIATHNSSVQDDAHSKSAKSEKKQNKLAKRIQWVEPTVGSYQVNYSAVDKNVPNLNFNRSTPHFFGQKYRTNQITPCLKNYPDGLLAKQKGLTDLGRMTGREQIKGYIRRNMENPHENRFQVKKFPVLTARAGSVAFSKMSPRKDFIKNELPLPDYDCNFEVNMKRLDSHIISFEKQTCRYSNVNKTISSEDYRTNQEKDQVLVDKTVSWSKQLPREVEGLLPTYMDKNINSRMALSLVNLKTLEMNCSDIKFPQKRLPRRKLGQSKGIIYKQKNCVQE